MAATASLSVNQRINETTSTTYLTADRGYKLLHNISRHCASSKKNFQFEKSQDILLAQKYTMVADKIIVAEANPQLDPK